MNRNNTVFLGILGWCYDCLVCFCVSRTLVRA
nr:MAG TPA: hypothetical protein [Caudoviricetes sp.]